jgi:Tfp pilus assembly protein PilF
VFAVQFLNGASAQEAYSKARVAANTALTLDPNLGAAYGAHGSLLLNADLDWLGAEADYRRALQLAPNDDTAKANLGQLLAAIGQPEQAIDLTRQALETDPLNARWYAWLCRFLSPSDHLDAAEQAIRNAIELRPEAAGYHALLTVVAIQRGDAKAALTSAQQERPGPYQDIALGLAQQIGGDNAAADAALQYLIQKDADSAAYQIAEVQALRKDPDQAFAWLDRAWASHDAGIQYLLYDPFLLRYKTDPRFFRVLPEGWIASAWSACARACHCSSQRRGKREKLAIRDAGSSEPVLLSEWTAHRSSSQFGFHRPDLYCVSTRIGNAHARRGPCHPFVRCLAVGAGRAADHRSHVWRRKPRWAGTESAQGFAQWRTRHVPALQA